MKTETETLVAGVVRMKTHRTMGFVRHWWTLFTEPGCPLNNLILGQTIGEAKMSINEINTRRSALGLPLLKVVWF
jgi:hypothetical protein